MCAMAFKPGDRVGLSRDGKVFLSQYVSVSGFASLTRELGADPEADLQEMQDDLDDLFELSVLRGFQKLNQLYDGMGGGPEEENPERLLEYLLKRSKTWKSLGVVGEPKKTTKKLRRKA